MLEGTMTGGMMALRNNKMVCLAGGSKKDFEVRTKMSISENTDGPPVVVIDLDEAFFRLPFSVCHSHFQPCFLLCTLQLISYTFASHSKMPYFF